MTYELNMHQAMNNIIANRRLHQRSAMVVIAVLSLTLGSAHADDKLSREREALRRAQMGLRQAQEERDAIASEKAAVESAKGKAETELKVSAGRAREAQGQLASARGRIAQMETKLQEQSAELDAARQRELGLTDQLQKLQAELTEKSRTVASVSSLLASATQDRQTLLAQNKALYSTGIGMVQLVRTHSPNEWLRVKDAVLGFKSVEAENVAEALRTRLDEAAFNAVSAGPSGPSASAAGTTQP